jgi:hypothetical protein
VQTANKKTPSSDQRTSRVTVDPLFAILSPVNLCCVIVRELGLSRDA